VAGHLTVRINDFARIGNIPQTTLRDRSYGTVRVAIEVANR
jgi:hypothetical protein